MITKCAGPIHFEDFDGKTFERLVFAYLQHTRRTWDLTWLGQRGKDQGRDIWATPQASHQDAENARIRSICVMCANYRALPSLKLRSDIAKLITFLDQRGKPKPETVLFFCGGEVTASVYDAADELKEAYGFSTLEIWSGAKFEERLRQDAPHLLRRFVNGEAFPEASVDFLPRDDRLWIQEIFAVEKPLRFVIGRLPSEHGRMPGLAHYLAIMLLKYTPLLPPAFARADSPYFKQAHDTLSKAGVLLPNAGEKWQSRLKEFTVMIGALPAKCRRRPLKGVWLSETAPRKSSGSRVKFFTVAPENALACLLLRLAGDSDRLQELWKDLSHFPKAFLGAISRYLAFHWPEVETDGMSVHAEVPPVPTLAGSTSLELLVPTHATQAEQTKSEADKLLSTCLEALSRQNFELAGGLLSQLNTRIIEGCPDRQRVCFSLLQARFALAMGDGHDAESELRRALQGTPDAVLAANLALLLAWRGDLEEAGRVLKAGIAGKPAPETQIAILALTAWRVIRAPGSSAEDIERALTDLGKQLASVLPRSAPAYYLLSQLNLEAARFTDAMKWADAAFTVDPHAPEYALQRAIVVLRQFPFGRPDYRQPQPLSLVDRDVLRAVTWLEDLRHTTAGRLRICSLVEHALGVAYYCAAMAVRPGNVRDERFAKSAEAFQRASQHSPPSFHLIGYAGEAWLRARSFTKALAALASIPPEERSAETHANLVAAQLLCGQVDQGLEQMDLLLRKKRLAPEAIANLGLLLLACGMPEQAQEVLRFAKPGMGPGNWRIDFLRGRALFQIGRYQESEASLWYAIMTCSFDPRICMAHWQAFQRAILPQLRDRFAVIRKLMARAGADPLQLDRREQEITEMLQAYYDELLRLQGAPVHPENGIARALDPFRRELERTRNLLSLLKDLLVTAESDCSSATIAQLRRAIDQAPPCATLREPPNGSVATETRRDRWERVQRELSDKTPNIWSRITLDKSGNKVLDALCQPHVDASFSQWLRLSAINFNIAQESEKLRAYDFVDGVDRRPYQESAVRRAVVRHYGRVLLADEVGLGKTIEAGLILTEYRARGQLKSCLILVPSRQLAAQWYGQLASKFRLRTTGTIELASGTLQVRI